MRQPNSRLQQAKAYGCMTLIVLVIVAIVFHRPIFMYSTQRTVVATVSDKENICRGNDNCKYLIYTDKGVFQNTDTFWYLKYNSSDVYGDIKKGHKYTFKVTGWRWGFWSWYPNVVKTTPAT